MSAYVPVDLQREVRAQFANCCAYCRTAEELTVVTFEFEHIVPRSLDGETVLRTSAWPVLRATDSKQTARWPVIQSPREMSLSFIHNAIFGLSTSLGQKARLKSLV